MTLLLLGCVLRAPEFVGMEVAAVEVTDVEQVRFAYVLGAHRTEATLVVTDTDGQRHPVRVIASGPSAGLLLQAGTSTELFGKTTRVHMDTPPGARGQDLFGRYIGESAGCAAIYGVHRRDLHNRAGVRWVETGPTLGFGAWYGADWMWLRPAP